VDGDFCKAALEKQVYIKDELPFLMGDATRLGMKIIVRYLNNTCLID
jgi:hypothetical protein